MELHPFVWVLIFALGAFALVLLLSFLVAISVAVAGRRYSDKLQKKNQAKIRAMLPGKNCGQCGCTDCDEFARSVYYGTIAEEACPHVDEDVPDKMRKVVADMLKQLEDPKPPKGRRNRMERLWDQKF